VPRGGGGGGGKTKKHEKNDKKQLWIGMHIDPPCRTSWSNPVGVSVRSFGPWMCSSASSRATTIMGNWSWSLGQKKQRRKGSSREEGFQIQGFFCWRNLESMVGNEGIIPLTIIFIGLCTLVANHLLSSWNIPGVVKIPKILGGFKMIQ